MTASDLDRDVAIVGAGPVGLFAVFECGMLGLKCHVIDALAEVGGQCAALYPEKPIYDIPAFTRLTGAELVERLAAQAAPFQPLYHLSQQVLAVTRTEDWRWRITTSAGRTLTSTAVIVAAGGGAFGPNRPPIPGLAAYEATGAVRYFVTRREELRGKRVVIAGGGDSAVDWAVLLSEIASHVAVVHRRDKFRAAEASVAKLQELVGAGRVEMVVPCQLDGLEGASGRLAAVLVRDLDGAARRLPADILLPFFGLAAELGPIATWGLDLKRNHVLVDPGTCQSSQPGLFAIGDIADYPGKLKLILTGFAEAAQAAHAIYPLVKPEQPLHFEYSTTKGLPTAAAGGSSRG